MSAVVLHLRNGLPAALAPDYRIKHVKVSATTTPAWTTVSNIEKSVVVPTGKVWIPISAYMTLNASTTVGTRRMTMVVQDDTGETVLEMKSYINHTVGLSITYMWAFGVENMATAIASNWATVTLPDYLLGGGWKITFKEANAIDVVGDSLTTPVMVVLEHDETP